MSEIIWPIIGVNVGAVIFFGMLASMKNHQTHKVATRPLTYPPRYPTPIHTDADPQTTKLAFRTAQISPPDFYDSRGKPQNIYLDLAPDAINRGDRKEEKPKSPHKPQTPGATSSGDPDLASPRKPQTPGAMYTISDGDDLQPRGDREEQVSSPSPDLGSSPSEALRANLNQWKTDDHDLAPDKVDREKQISPPKPQTPGATYTISGNDLQPGGDREEQVSSPSPDLGSSLSKALLANLNQLK